MKNHLFAFGLSLTILPAVCLADDIVAGTDTTLFSSGSPALASQLNGNFDVLIDAVNGLSARLDALEAAGSTGGGDLASIIGSSSYTLFFYENVFDVSPTNAWVSTAGYTMRLHFTEQGFTREVGYEKFTYNTSDTVSFYSSTEPVAPFPGGGTWTLVDSVLTLSALDEDGEDTETLVGLVSGDGNTMIFMSNDVQDNVPEAEIMLGVGIRLPES